MSVSMMGNLQGAICYTSPEMARLEPDHLEKKQMKVNQLLPLMFRNPIFVAMLFNFNIDDRLIVVSVSDMMSWTPQGLRKKLQGNFPRRR